MVKKLLIDLSWIDHKTNAGGEAQALNTLEIILNKKNLKKFNFFFFIKPNTLKNKKFNFLRKYNFIKLTNFNYINYIVILFFGNFILKINKINIYYSTNIYKPIFNFFNLTFIVSLNHPLWLERPDLCNPIKKLLYDIYYPTLKNSSLLVCSNQGVEEIFKKKFKYKNITYIEIPFKKFKRKIDKKKINKKILKLKKNRFFFTLSTLESYKNIEILKKLKYKNFQFILAGKRYNKLIKHNNFLDLGEINDDEKCWLYSNCSAYIHPSKYEGFGMILIEAMMYNKRIFCSNTRIIKKVTDGKVEYINNPDSTKEWNKKIKFALKKKKNNYKLVLKKYKSRYINLKWQKIFNKL